MADGILCRHCGYQETVHEFWDDADGKIDGYKHTIETCPGYEPNDQELAAELQKAHDDDKKRKLQREGRWPRDGIGD